ncbi:hypothetical protein C8Q80DRAFT_1305209 [Daedaleopsis nitida]|nr:hypothetical protein C8Q80DRAFT_1305209 [Daedaleopsis nitida]
MSSRHVPTIDFAHPPPPAQASVGSACTDGSDHKLKQQLKGAATIMSCVVVHGRARLEPRPYPRDAQGIAIALSDLEDYTSTHTWLDNVYCFCTAMFGTAPRLVHVVKPSAGSWSTHIVLGFDLSELVKKPRFVDSIQLQTFPLRVGSHVGVDCNGSNDIICQIHRGSGGPLSSQESGAPLSSQGSLTMSTGACTSLASHSRHHLTASNDSTIIVLHNPIAHKPKWRLFLKAEPAATAARSKPVPVKPAAGAAPLPGPVIVISDDKPQVSAPSTQRAKRAKQGSAASATPPAPTARKGVPVSEADVIVVSDDDAVGGALEQPEVVLLKRTAVKASMRQRTGHMSTRAGAVPPVAGSSSQGATVAKLAPSAPDVFTVDGQAPGSQGAVFVETTSSVTGERRIYMLAGKK